MDEKMIARQDLLAGMVLVKGMMKLTPGERRKEVRRQSLIELKAMELERRERVTLETMKKWKRDRKEREKETESWRREKERIVEERMRQERQEEAMEKIKQDQQKKEGLQWKKVMLWPRCTIAPENDREWSQEEIELCCLPTVGVKANPESLTFDPRLAEMKKKILYNNWVREEKPDKKKTFQNSSIYHLFAARPVPKSQEQKQKTPEPNETVAGPDDVYPFEAPVSS
ncbi:golgin subfamily A member 6-like protein 22 [Sebastes umbrosus]|uniref:golgin subfamily A member 6-like protein 22 n=1 Tax=Sebastes umbrosus TaxID=72105 RepID=UPI00189F2E9A|nr:golgin subfamily A member 6-like protein 22 [Sebastes umbrosus]